MADETAVVDAPAGTGLEGAEERFTQLFNPEQQQDGSVQNDPLQTQAPAKAAPAPAKETGIESSPSKDEFPMEFLTGEKPKPVEDVDADVKRLMEAEPPPQLRSEAAKESFKTWKADAAKAIEARNARIAEFEKTINELKSNGTVTDEIKAQIKQRDDRLAELESLVERTNFEKSPKFQAMVARESQHITAAKGYLEGSDIDPGVIEAAARVTGAKRFKILTDAGVEDRMLGMIEARLSRYDEVQADKSSALESAKQTASQWEAEQKQLETQKQAQMRAEEDRLFSQVGETVTRSFEPFQDVPGNEGWNTQAKALREEAKAFFNGQLPMEKVAEIAYYGVGAKVIHGMFHSLREKYQAQATEIQQLKAAQPGGGVLQNGQRKALPEDLMDRSVQVFEDLMHRGT